MSWFDEGSGGGSPVDVAAVMDSAAPDAVWEIVQLGAMASFFTTGDGGALGFQVTLDGRHRRVYVRDSEELCTFLAEALPAVRSELDRLSASSGPAPRSRRRRGG
jgi:hypothetical protein